MAYHFLNIVVTSKLLYIVFVHGWETVFYHTYTVKVYYQSLFDILSVKTNYEEFSNLKRIEKKIEKSSDKQTIGFDREDMK